MITIMIGLPGSGKSTLAKQLVREHLRTPYTQAMVVSADDFFTAEDGTYDYVASAIGSAHLSCQSEFTRHLERFRSKDLLVVDNTNLRSSDRKFYLQSAEQYGHLVQMVHVPCTVEQSVARNTHGVPEDRIREMAATAQYPTEDPRYKVHNG